MLLKKPPDFVHDRFDAEICPKCMEICSQKKIAFSLTIRYLDGEIISVDVV